MELKQVLFSIACFVAILNIATAYKDNKDTEFPLYDSYEVDSPNIAKYTEAFDFDYDQDSYPHDLDDPDLPWLEEDDDTSDGSDDDISNGSDDDFDNDDDSAADWDDDSAEEAPTKPQGECSEKDVIMSPISKGDVRKTNWFPLWGAKDKVWHVKVTNNCPGHDLLVLKVVVNFLHAVPTTDPKFLKGLRGCVKGSSDTQFFCTLDTDRLQRKGEKKSTKWISYPREAKAKDPPLSFAVQAPSWMRTAAVFEGQKYGSADSAPKA